MATDPHAHAAAADAAAHGAEHGSAAFPPFDPSLFAHQIIWFAICFIALYLVMKNVALPKVASVLERRAGVIKADLDSAHRKSAAAEEAKIAMDKAVAGARAEARGLIDDMRLKTQASLAEEQAAAETSLIARGEAAEKRIAEARAAAMKDVDSIAADLARDIVAKLTPAGARA